MPERYGRPGEGDNAGVLSVDKRMRAVLIRIIELDRLLQMFPGGDQLSQVEGRIPKRKMCLDEETRISRPLRKAKKLLAQLMRNPVFTSDQVKRPQSEENGEELGGFIDLPTEVERPGVSFLHFRRCISLDSHQWSTQRNLQRELLLGALWCVRQSLEQLQSGGQVADRLRVRRTLHSLLCGKLRILDRLRCISAMAIVMRQLAQVLF